MNMIQIITAAGWVVALSAGASQTGANTLSLAPHAAQKAHVIESPNGVRNDPYYWLRDDSRHNPEVLSYLDAENQYYDKYRSRYVALEQTVAEEMIARLQPEDDSVPYKDGQYYYFSRALPGKDYHVELRRKGMDGEEEVILDGNEEARRSSYYSNCALQISPDESLMVFGTDTQGRYQCRLHVRDLATGKDRPDLISGSGGSVAWAADSQSFIYVENDPQTLLSSRVKRHVLGEDARLDKIVYEETDKSFYLSVAQSSDHHYLMINLSSTVASETRVLGSDQADTQWRILIAREKDFLFDVEHVNANWVIRHNGNAPNYRVSTASDDEITHRMLWHDIVAPNNKRLISEMAVFNKYLVVGEKVDANQQLRVVDWANGKSRVITADEPAYMAALEINAEVASTKLRYSYTSLTTPATVYSYDMETGKQELLKETPVGGGFDKHNYVTERRWVTARDGVKIPVSLVYRKGFKADGHAPALEYGYGSYGISMSPYFSSDRLSLLDRGFVFVIAHIRGGQELGRQWYDQGKLLNKMNTFNDFIDVGDYLVKQKYAAPDKLFAMGGSAGGLLMGAVANLRPDLYKGMIAAVPFVDVVTTMLDESIPLTTNEFDEWGNPKLSQYYNYMLKYSPYDNVKAQAYPAMLVATGLNDSQVQYYEPSKWVAKLRDLKTDNNPLLLRVNMDAGHGGKSGRYQARYERAQDFAFMLDLAGFTK